MPPLPPASLIAFVSQTGNVMKTTLAAAVGIAMVAAEHPTVAIDLDLEHRRLGDSLATWLKRRARNHPQRPQLPVLEPDTVGEALAMAATRLGHFVLMDCPSRASAVTDHVVDAADFVVLPIQPNAKDVRLTLKTIERILQFTTPDRLAVVLTRTRSAAEAADYRHLLEAKRFASGGLTVLTPSVPEKTAYNSAISKALAITEAQPVTVGMTARIAVNAIIDAYSRILTAASPKVRVLSQPREEHRA